MITFKESMRLLDSKKLIVLLESNMKTQNTSKEGSLTYRLSTIGITTIRQILGERFIGNKLQNKEITEADL